MSPPISSRSARAALATLPLTALAGCSGIQASLDPAGPNAEATSVLAWVMFAGGAVILVIVLTAVAWSIRAGRSAAPKRNGRRTIILGGVAFPLVTVSALLVFGLILSNRLIAAPEEEALTIRVDGEQWWWRVAYLDQLEQPVLVTANEIHIPVGRPVRFLLESDNVIHSFWVPALGGKLDMIPGRTNDVVLEASQPGTYRGQCAEFCGEQHALMAFMVVAHEQAEFDAWLAGQQAAAIEPVTDQQAAGADLFDANGCGACHTVRGTAADGLIGPDLTHVGSRLTIAAGTLPTSQGTLAGWIADAQDIKPGTAMPSFDRLTGPELRALAAYLEGLR